jgi:signal transduction histidine kinase
MNDDDMYVSHQTLAALVNVLLHDLRNPLHSGSLLVEAMASRTADPETLRGKLRAQFAKLDALISEASGPIRELTLETRAETHSVDSLARSIARALDEAGSEAHLALPPASSLTVFVDALLLVRAVVELSATIVERQTSRPSPDSAPGTVALRVVESDPDTVRLDFGDFAAQLEGPAAKAPFAIAGGGVRLALARALSQSAGASLRLEQTPQGLAHFAIYAPKAPPPIPAG